MNIANYETMRTILLSALMAKLFGSTHEGIIGPKREIF